VLDARAPRSDAKIVREGRLEYSAGGTRNHWSGWTQRPVPPGRRNRLRFAEWR